MNRRSFCFILFRLLCRFPCRLIRQAEKHHLCAVHQPFPFGLVLPFFFADEQELHSVMPFQLVPQLQSRCARLPVNINRMLHRQTLSLSKIKSYIDTIIFFLRIKSIKICIFIRFWNLRSHMPEFFPAAQKKPQKVTFPATFSGIIYYT